MEFLIFFLFFGFVESKTELKFIQTVFRHGARVPDDIIEYPNDLYTSEDWYPVAYGGLTNIGKQKSFELGKFFRQRYNTFLGTNRHPDVVGFFSSSADRAKMSGQLVATGLYPPQPHERWNKALNWQPMPIKSPTSVTQGWWYYSSVGVCSNFEKEQKIAEETEPELMKYLDENKEFYRNISRFAGFNGTHDLVYRVYVTVSAETEIGLSPPEWTKGLMPAGKLEKAASEVFLIRGFNNKLKKMAGGVWLKIWLDNIEDFVGGRTPKRKAFFWSGHDQNIGDSLVALGAFDEPHVPPYNSAIILELHQDGLDYFVKALYKRDYYIEPLIVLGCNNFLCPLEVFKKELSTILPEDLDKTCGNDLIFQQ